MVLSQTLGGAAGEDRDYVVERGKNRERDKNEITTMAHGFPSIRAEPPIRERRRPMRPGVS